MVWGKAASSGIDDFVKRLQDDDARLQSLTILRFRRLNDSDVDALAKALSGNCTLQELNCSSHTISVEASASLGSMLQKNTALKNISIGNSSWGDQALAALAKGLKHNSSVTVWDLEHKGLSAASAASILEVLQLHPALQQVLLSRNVLADAGLQQLCAAPWASLRHLELADCSLSAQGLSALADAHSLRQLGHLDLSHNQLGPGAGQPLGHLLTNATQLQSLKLNSTGLGGPGVAGLARSLAAASQLKHLDLSNTQLDNSGIEALAAALTSQCTPQQQQPGAASAASAPVASCSQPRVQLQQLLLAGNPQITDAAVAKLAVALTAGAGAAGRIPVAGDAGLQLDEEQQGQQQAPHPVHLDLAEAVIGAEGIQALSKLPGLKQLSLFGCNLGGHPFNALQSCIANGGFAELQGLNLSGCQLRFEHLKSLMQQLAADSTSSCKPNNIPEGNARSDESSTANACANNAPEAGAEGIQGGQAGEASASFAVAVGVSGSKVCGALTTLELGANPGVQQDGFQDLVQGLREARPGLDVHWRVADSDAPPAGIGQG